MSKKSEEREARYPWMMRNDILKEQFPWLDKDYVADVTRKPNVDGWKKLKQENEKS